MAPSFADATWVFARIAANSFGGPAGQIAVMHRILVDEERYIEEDRFLHALNVCMLLPGPEAMQLVTYVGWTLHGVRGGLMAGGLFVLPGFVAIFALSCAYVLAREVAIIDGLFFGLKAAVLAVVVEALLRIGKRAQLDAVGWTLAASAFVALFVFSVPFPVIVLLAALIGGVRAAGAAPGPASARPSFVAAGRTALVWGAVWWAPVGVLAAVVGGDHVLTEVALFFSGAAMVTFGGAYAVLAYVAQQAVEVHGWLLPGEMLDGLGMAETTPGPLVQVVQFVGFMAAWRESGGLSPLAAGLAGSVITTWVTFAPCFLWIFTLAPYVEWLRGQPRLASALRAVTAAVVGVIAQLAVWFALHVLFAEQTAVVGVPAPVLGSVRPAAVLIAAISAWMLFRTRVGMVWTLVGAAALGALLA